MYIYGGRGGGRVGKSCDYFIFYFIMKHLVAKKSDAMFEEPTTRNVCWNYLKGLYRKDLYAYIGSISTLQNYDILELFHHLAKIQYSSD